MENIGQQIKAYRNLRGLSQSQLADLCNVGKITISKYERGVLTPRLESTLPRICAALGVDLSVMVSLTPKKIISEKV